MTILSGSVVSATMLNRLQPVTYAAVCSASLVGPQTDADITGASITLTTETDLAIVMIDAAVSFNWSANTAVATVECWQGSTPLTGKAISDPDNTTGRVTAYQTWRVNPGAAGSYTFKLVGESIPTNMTVDATHTAIHCTVYEDV